MDPLAAGTITGNTTSATADWDVAFTGTATITVQGHNSCGFGPISNPLSVTINSAPLVDLGADRTVCGSEILDAENAGSSYLWSTGTVSQTLTVSGSGSYWVRVTSGNGCIDRDTVAIIVNPAPNITTQPISQTVCVETNIPLSIVVSGVGPYTYQWQKNGVDLVEGGNISGSQTVNLTIGNAQIADSGDYTCIVTGSCGDITSDTALINIIPIPITGSYYHISNTWAQ